MGSENRGYVGYVNSAWNARLRDAAAHVPIAIVILAALTIAVPLAHAHFTSTQSSVLLALAAESGSRLAAEHTAELTLPGERKPDAAELSLGRAHS